MSATRPYKITVGGDTYMVTATSREQAGRIALSSYPSPVVEVSPASANDVLAWVSAGKQVFTKETFVARSIPTLVMYVDADGQLGPAGFHLDPGNYHLVIEREVAAPAETVEDIGATEAVKGDGAEATMADIAAADVAGDIEQFDPETGEIVAEEEPLESDGDVLPEADMPVVYDDGIPVADLAPEDTFPAPVDDAPSGLGTLPDNAGEVVNGIKQPEHFGAFAGDVFRGDPENPERVTHVWRKKAWQAYDRADDNIAG